MAEIDKNNTNNENIQLNEAPVHESASVAEITPTQAEPVVSSNLSIKKQPKWSWIKKILKNKKIYIPATIIVLITVLSLGLTDLKYNLFGLVIKKDVQIEVVDDKTLQPISGVEIELADKKIKTDGEGKANLSQVKLGKSKLKLSKQGYETKEQNTIIRFSTTKIEPIRIIGEGYTISFIVKDRVTGELIKGAKLTLGGAESQTNDKGEATTSVLPSGGAKLTLSTSKDGFNTLTQEMEIAENSPVKEIILTPAGTVVYVSNKDKKYNLYASDLDGKNERVILEASGKEDGQTAIYPSPDGKYVALLASREGRSEGYGSLQQELYVINIGSGELKKLANQPGLVEWWEDTLVYSAVVNDSTYETKVTSYNAETKAEKDLIDQTIYYFSLSEGKVYYTLGDPNKPEYGIYTIDIDGSGKKKLTDKPLSILRKNIQSLSLIDYEAQEVSALSLTDNSIIKSEESLQKESLSVVAQKNSDNRYFTRIIDSYPQLFKSQIGGGEEKQLTKGANVSNGFFVSENGLYIVFYGTVGTEAGVYIVSANGGVAQKIASGHLPPKLGPGGF